MAIAAVYSFSALQDSASELDEQAGSFEHTSPSSLKSWISSSVERRRGGEGRVSAAARLPEPPLTQPPTLAKGETPSTVSEWSNAASCDRLYQALMKPIKRPCEVL